MRPGERGLGRWPCEQRRQFRAAQGVFEELRARVALLEGQAESPASALALAAATGPVVPRPYPVFVVAIALDGYIGASINAGSPAEERRLVNWLNNGPYAGVFDEVTLALARDMRRREQEAEEI